MCHILFVQDPGASTVQRYDNVNLVRFLFLSHCTIIVALNMTAFESRKDSTSFLKCQLLVSGLYSSLETNTRHLLYGNFVNMNGGNTPFVRRHVERGVTSYTDYVTSQ
jgi:hypothetical protein